MKNFEEWFYQHASSNLFLSSPVILQETTTDVLVAHYVSFKQE